ncbi:MAG TPA: ABC transporter permease [Acidobacteriota bacterium]|nr:ABC transporter permease [Acidobacteriota bacterium]
MQDVKYGIRLLARSPVTTLIAVLTLGLGIGANSAIFSVVNGVLLQPLPYEERGRLLIFHQQAPGAVQPWLRGDDMLFSVKELADYRQQCRSFQEVVEYHSRNFVVWGSLQPHQVDVGVVSANFFHALGVKPLIGRTFLPGEDQPGTDPIAVLSHEYWQGRLGGDRDVVGRLIKIDDKMHEVVGVLPAIPEYPRHNDLYMPISHCPSRSSQATMENRDRRMLSVFAVLKPEAGLEQAQADVSSVAARMAQEHPQHYPPEWNFQAHVTPLKEELTREARPTFLILLAVSGMVLLIACANVANLSLSRLLRRRREMAMRSALGAGRARLLRQLVTESSLAALAGGVVGLVMAYAVLDLLVGFAARFTPRAVEISLDWTVVLFTLFVSLAAGVLFGVLPALQLGGRPPEALSGGGRGVAGSSHRRLRQGLVVAQIAVALVLLTAAGLLVRSFGRLNGVDAGFEPHNVLTMRIGLNYAKFRQEAGSELTPARRAYLQEATRQVRALPGVQAAGLVSLVPLGDAHGHDHFLYIKGRQVEPQALPKVSHLTAEAGYFKALGIPLLRGRHFSPSDDNQAPEVAIITHSTARRHWPGQNPVGQYISIHQTDDDEGWVRIVGVVGDVRRRGLDQEAVDEVFLPFTQAPFASRLVARTRGDPQRLAQAMIEAVRSVDPDQTVDSVVTMEQLRSDSIAPVRLTASLVGLFSLLALAITAAGIAAVMALMVSQLAHEIGVRRALGAHTSHILRLVLGRSLGLTALGCLLGLAAALALGRYLEHLLFQVSPSDPVTLALTCLLVLLAALAASYIPARRALQVDPRRILHQG